MPYARIQKVEMPTIIVRKQGIWDNPKHPLCRVFLRAEEAVTEANNRRLRLLSNPEVDRHLPPPKIIIYGDSFCPIQTGTAIAYDDERLEALIRFDNYCIEVPAEARNQKGVILAVNHGFDENGNPNFKFVREKDGIWRLVAPKIEVLEGFPPHDGWYAAEKKFGIPLGKKIDWCRPDARFLHRRKRFIGLVARGCDGIDPNGYRVDDLHRHIFDNYKDHGVPEESDLSRIPGAFDVIAEETGLQTLSDAPRHLEDKR